MNNAPQTWEDTLVGYGIEVGLLISGFFGAMLMVGRRSAKNIGTTVASILAGTACANYLTPVVLHFAPASIQESRSKYAAAFMMGFIGLKGLEIIVERWFGERGTAVVAELQPPKKRTRKRKSSTRKPKGTTSQKDQP